MEEDNYSQQELFEQRKYISDLIEEKTEKKRSSLNVVIGSALLSSGIVIGFLFLFGLFEEEEIVLPEPITITETIKEKELVMPRVDSTEVVSIAELATKSREKKITLQELQGGTFSITNGGVFGSLMSTPLLNPPQVGILGMHKIMEKPLAVDGEIVIRPVMMLAVTYDHRIIDGSMAVQFLVRIKNLLEDPYQLLIDA